MHIKVIGGKMSVILFIKGRFNYPLLFIGWPPRHWEIITADSVMALYLHTVEVANHSSVYFSLIMCYDKTHNMVFQRQSSMVCGIGWCESIYEDLKCELGCAG